MFQGFCKQFKASYEFIIPLGLDFFSLLYGLVDKQLQSVILSIDLKVKSPVTKRGYLLGPLFYYLHQLRTVLKLDFWFDLVDTA